MQTESQQGWFESLRDRRLPHNRLRNRECGRSFMLAPLALDMDDGSDERQGLPPEHVPDVRAKEFPIRHGFLFLLKKRMDVFMLIAGFV